MAEDRHVNWLFAQARISRDPYHYADALNAMQEGKCVKIPGHEIAFIKGSWIRGGWRIVMENTIGSAHDTCWSFRDYPDGDVVCCKLAGPRTEPTPKPVYVVPFGSVNLLDCTKPEQDAEGGTM